MLDKKILSILACPVCKGKVHYQIEQKEIWCKGDGLAFPVRDGIPVMLENEARDLNSDEKLSKV